MRDPIWHLSCAETLLGDSTLAVFVVEDEDRLRALAPLQLSQSFPRGFEIVGARSLNEPCDLFYTDEAALQVLLAALAHARQPLVLGRTYRDTQTLAAIHAAFAGRGLVVTRPCSGLPYIDLSQAGRSAAGLLRGRLRADLRHARRKAEAMGRVQFEVHAPRTEQEFQPLFAEALTVEAAGWKGRMHSALANDALRRAFFARYGLRAARKGILRITCLRIDAQPAAMQIAVQTGDGFWLLKIGYDETYAKCSPGLLLMYESLKFAAQEGLGSYEFLGSSEPWIQRWTRRERSSIRIDVYPFSASGVSALGHDLAQRAGGKLRQVFTGPR